MRWPFFLTLVAFASSALSSALAAQGNADRGQRVFGACAACHSLEPNRSMTGPSLAELWNRKAGNLASFPRYSSALKSSTIVWNDKTLDDWLKDPQHLVPGNSMTFQGIKNDQQRADLLAFLKQATQPGHAPPQMGGMGGMGGGGGVPNLKKPDPEQRVEAITYCGDTYRVTTGDGKMHAFWERNLRLKTDSSGDGPDKGAPALVGASMMGDRADVIFAAPDEISGFIKKECSGR
ncbi:MULTISPECIES: c-type cytochrome [unclassified Bradyrhizobium]|uniref:c-type cytochrome n=1 Tax=unclassified Bradyrhizobium TaxID=2631580 RepID=UPI002478BDD6|nr:MULTISPECIES: c-type cytochrome [unclassified Bradyrhizobium]WGS21081.1 c-type cytochrome [Bradyrhizobium sp. ISRA463]WGS27998.1 c-type cytochrome [Bradyrhizobium sp. ISRA464]